MSTPAILCDIGNVLVSFDFSIAAQRLAQRSLFTTETVLQPIEELKVAYENGDITDETFVREAISKIGFRGTPTDFTQIWTEIFAINPPMNALMDRLAGRMPLHLLSNTSAIHHHYLVATYPVFHHFSSGVFSYLARSLKPEPAIFQIAMDQLGIDPTATLFIDDLPANIATAQTLGFVTHRYDLRRHQDFEETLAAWLASVS